MHRHEAEALAYARQLAEVRLRKLYVVSESRKRLRGDFQGAWVGIHAEQQPTGRSCLHNRSGMTAGADCAVHVATAGPDRQGRILIPPLLRQQAAVDGGVLIAGRKECLEIWNPRRLEEALQAARAASSAEQAPED